MMVERLLGGAIFGVFVGGLVFMLSGALLTVGIERWLARTSDVKRKAFLVEHTSAKKAAEPFAVGLAFAVLGMMLMY